MSIARYLRHRSLCIQAESLRMALKAGSTLQIFNLDLGQGRGFPPGLHPLGAAQISPDIDRSSAFMASGVVPHGSSERWRDPSYTLVTNLNVAERVCTFARLPPDGKLGFMFATF